MRMHLVMLAITGVVVGAVILMVTMLIAIWAIEKLTKYGVAKAPVDEQQKELPPPETSERQ